MVAPALISQLGHQKQAGFCESKNSLVFIESQASKGHIGIHISKNINNKMLGKQRVLPLRLDANTPLDISVAGSAPPSLVFFPYTASLHFMTAIKPSALRIYS